MDYRLLESLDRLEYELNFIDLVPENLDTPDVFIKKLQEFNYNLTVANLTYDEFLKNSFEVNDKKGLKEFYKNRVLEFLVSSIRSFIFYNSKMVESGVVDSLSIDQKIKYLQEHEVLTNILTSITENYGIVSSNDDKTNNQLSAFEIALRQWYLVKYGEETFLTPVQVGLKFKEIRNHKNIEDCYRDLECNPPRRKPNKTHLENILRSIKDDYPLTKKALINDIDNY